MSITVQVELFSGRATTVQANFDEAVGTLKRRAETALGRLVDSSGGFLDAETPIKRTRLRHGDSLNLNVSRVQVQANLAIEGSFAAILGDASVLTWGDARHGGDSSAVQDQLKNVQQIQANCHAFAAVLADGSAIHATYRAFAALLSNGSVVTWGYPDGGGDSDDVQDQLRNVQQIPASRGVVLGGAAFAAILGDGSVVTWGDARHGGDSSAVQDQLKNVQQIQANCHVFAAILADGSVVTWGAAGFGGVSSVVQDQLKNVQQIQASHSCFAAILGDGSVVTWGISCHGGDSSAVQDQLKHGSAVAAILIDGSVGLGLVQTPRLGALAGFLDTEWAMHFPAGDGNPDNDLTFPVLPFLDALRAWPPRERSVMLALTPTNLGPDPRYFEVDRQSLSHLEDYAERQPGAVPSCVILLRSSFGLSGEAPYRTLNGLSPVFRVGSFFDLQHVDHSESWTSQWHYSDFGVDELVGALKLRGQTALGVGNGQLLNASGQTLDAFSTIKDAGLQDSDSLILLHSNKVQVHGCRQAFAAILGDGSVVNWGHAVFGAGSSAVRQQVKNVQSIQASAHAFAAILGDGTVVTWGHTASGGDSTAVQDQLKNVRQIQASTYAFAAIVGDGSVVTWGEADGGGDSNAVQHQLKNVQQIQATRGGFGGAFAAILGDGSVVTWGNVGAGGDSNAAQHQLKNVLQVQATGTAFAAALGAGSVISWGDAMHGGDSSAAQNKLKNVQQIQASRYAFAAIVGDGSVVTWGKADGGGDSNAVQHQLKNVQQIQATARAFTAILGDGSVITWGHAGLGGDSAAVQAQLKNVQQIQATSTAFAAILGDGSVVTWGKADEGGDSRAVQGKLT
eukprot:s7511_g1.t1